MEGAVGNNPHKKVWKEDENLKNPVLWQELKMFSRKQTKIFTKLIVSSTYLTSWSAADSGDGMVGGFSRGSFRTHAMGAGEIYSVSTEKCFETFCLEVTFRCYLLLVS
jgi:hypothetical protein